MTKSIAQCFGDAVFDRKDSGLKDWAAYSMAAFSMAAALTAGVLKGERVCAEQPQQCITVKIANPVPAQK